MATEGEDDDQRPNSPIRGYRPREEDMPRRLFREESAHTSGQTQSGDAGQDLHLESAKIHFDWIQESRLLVDAVFGHFCAGDCIESLILSWGSSMQCLVPDAELGYREAARARPAHFVRQLVRVKRSALGDGKERDATVAGDDAGNLSLLLVDHERVTIETSSVFDFPVPSSRSAVASSPPIAGPYEKGNGGGADLLLVPMTPSDCFLVRVGADWNFETRHLLGSSECFEGVIDESARCEDACAVPAPSSKGFDERGRALVGMLLRSGEELMPADPVKVAVMAVDCENAEALFLTHVLDSMEEGAFSLLGLSPYSEWCLAVVADTQVFFMSQKGNVETVGMEGGATFTCAARVSSDETRIVYGTSLGEIGALDLQGESLSTIVESFRRCIPDEAGESDAPGGIRCVRGVSEAGSSCRIAAGWSIGGFAIARVPEIGPIERIVASEPVVKAPVRHTVTLEWPAQSGASALLACAGDDICPPQLQRWQMGCSLVEKARSEWSVQPYDIISDGCGLLAVSFDAEYQTLAFEWGEECCGPQEALAPVIGSEPTLLLRRLSEMDGKKRALHASPSRLCILDLDSSKVESQWSASGDRIDHVASAGKAAVAALGTQLRWCAITAAGGLAGSTSESLAFPVSNVAAAEVTGSVIVAIATWGSSRIHNVAPPWLHERDYGAWFLGEGLQPLALEIICLGPCAYVVTSCAGGEVLIGQFDASVGVIDSEETGSCQAEIVTLRQFSIGTNLPGLARVPLPHGDGVMCSGDWPSLIALPQGECQTEPSVTSVHGADEIRLLSQGREPLEVVWISTKGHLCFGELEYERKLRAQVNDIGACEEVLAIDYHARSQCAVLVARDSHGGTSIRAFHMAKMEEVASCAMPGDILGATISVQPIALQNGGASFAGERELVLVSATEGVQTHEGHPVRGAKATMWSLDIVWSRGVGGGGERDKIELRHLGAVGLPAPVFDIRRVGVSQSNATHLACACNDGVRVFSASVDYGRRAEEGVLAARLLSGSGAATFQQPAEGATGGTLKLSEQFHTHGTTGLCITELVLFNGTCAAVELVGCLREIDLPGVSSSLECSDSRFTEQMDPDVAMDTSPNRHASLETFCPVQSACSCCSGGESFLFASAHPFHLALVGECAGMGMKIIKELDMPFLPYQLLTGALAKPQAPAKRESGALLIGCAGEIVELSCQL